jgi:L-phenylalanine/L-methionine N-acetyltransferase
MPTETIAESLSYKPPAGLAIRGTRPQDAEQIAAMINLPGFRHGTLRTPFETPEEVRRRIEQRPESTVSIVAELDGKIIGNAGLYRLAGRRQHVGEIGIGVHDDWQGRGVGRALMLALLDTADRWLGLKRVQLTVYTDNERGIRLYRSLGFETEGCHRAYAWRDGAFADALCMARVRVKT